MNISIIHNRAGITDIQALQVVLEVVKMGRVSNNNRQYSYATTFEHGDEQIVVLTDLNKNSDRFTIHGNSSPEDPPGQEET